MWRFRVRRLVFMFLWDMLFRYVKCGRDLVTQSNACVLYLARKFGLLGSSVEETVRVKQVSQRAALPFFVVFVLLVHILMFFFYL